MNVLSWLLPIIVLNTKDQVWKKKEKKKEVENGVSSWSIVMMSFKMNFMNTWEHLVLIGNRISDFGLHGLLGHPQTKIAIN